MNKFILAATLAATLGLPSIALAADTMMAPTSVVCHTAKAGETANAAMGDTKLACTAVNMTKVHEAMDTVHNVMVKQQATPDQMKQMQSAMNALSNLLQLNIAGGSENANRG